MDKVFREVEIGNEKVKIHEVKVGDTIVREVKVGWGTGNKIAFTFASIMAIVGWFSLFLSPVLAIILIVLSLLWYRHIRKSIKKKSTYYVQKVSEMERQKQEEMERQRKLMEAENRKKWMQDWDE